jgi:hypothetical protein
MLMILKGGAFRTSTYIIQWNHLEDQPSRKSHQLNLL